MFTHSGTGSDNLGVKGIFWARRAADPSRTRILSSRVEHHAVLEAVQWLVQHAGAQVTWLEVDELGRVHPDVLDEALDDDVALATVMWADNEVGTVQPVRALAETAHQDGVPLHSDAVQAVGQLLVDFVASGVDALTVTGHKHGGPHGGAALLLADDVPCTPLLHGGAEDARSSNVPALAGFAAATRLAVERRARTAEHLTALRDDLVRRVRAAVPSCQHTGDPVDRLPGNAHFSFPGCEGDLLVLLLDARGVEVSTGSACVSGVARPSHVLTAMGADEPRAQLAALLARALLHRRRRGGTPAGAPGGGAPGRPHVGQRRRTGWGYRSSPAAAVPAGTRDWPRTASSRSFSALSLPGTAV